MLQLTSGSIRLFRLAGINVYLHWSWFLVAVIEIQNRVSDYSSVAWNVAEYVSLFVIVLLHEFGHALACRSVGGIARQIVLWPLGGVAFVQPPQRPGPVLWSIAAGPLVNVLLVPVTVGLWLASRSAGWADSSPDLHRFLISLAFMNGVLLFFNLLPIYPLDGGQILQSLLWFIMGRAQSLMAVSILGLITGMCLLILLAVLAVAGVPGLIWFGILAAFVVWRSWIGFQQARLLAEMANQPRHTDFACPGCGAAPIMGPFWRCHRCREQFDTFEQGAVCPRCDTVFPTTQCLDCLRAYPFAEWHKAAVPVNGYQREAD